MGKLRVVQSLLRGCWPSPAAARRDAIVSHALTDVGADASALELSPDVAVKVRPAGAVLEAVLQLDVTCRLVRATYACICGVPWG